MRNWVPAVMLPLLAAGCSGGKEAVPPRPVTDTLAGLYEGSGTPATPRRICIAGNGPEARFGLNSSYEEPESCTAKGRVSRAGAKLTLVIDGDPACTLSATVTRTGLTLDKAQGPECGYYCGRNTVMTFGAFQKVGTSAADIGKAVDIAGEPLC